MKALFWISVAVGAFAAMWWFGWFKPIANQFLQIKRNTVQTARP